MCNIAQNSIKYAHRHIVWSDCNEFINNKMVFGKWNFEWVDWFKPSTISWQCSKFGYKDEWTNAIIALHCNGLTVLEALEVCKAFMKLCKQTETVLFQQKKILQIQVCNKIQWRMNVYTIQKVNHTEWLKITVCEQ